MVNTDIRKSKSYQSVLHDSDGTPLREKIAEYIQEVTAKRFPRLSQTQLATLINLSGPNLSQITNGKVSDFSEIRLLNVVANLGYDVEIKIKARPQAVIDEERRTNEEATQAAIIAEATSADTGKKKRGRRFTPVQDITIKQGGISLVIEEEAGESK